MKKSTPSQLAKAFGISEDRAKESVVKAQLISAIINAISENNWTHQAIAKRSGLPRSAVTGILSGSLQKVTIDRVLRILHAVNLTADIKIRKIA